MPPKGEPCCYVITNEISLGNTTLINGIEYTQVLSNDTETCLFREENGIVYRYNENNGEDYIVFDFTLEMGDIFPIFESVYSSNPLFSSCTDSFLLSTVWVESLTVASVDFIEVAGETRKIISFEENGFLQYAWIEGIGNVSGFDLMDETVDVTEYSLLSCFTTNGVTYFFNDATSCENTTLGLTENLQDKILLFPNPVKQTSILQWSEQNEIDVVKIISISGQIIREDLVSKNFYTIDAMHFASGLYFYQVYSENKLIKTEKFVIK